MPMQPHTEPVRRGKANGHGKPKSKKVKVEKISAADEGFISEQMTRIRSALDNQARSHEAKVAAIIEEGAALSALKDKFKGNWMPVRQRLCDEFKYYETKIDQLKKIADHKVLSDSRNYGNLPTSLACLYELAKINDLPRMQQLIKSGDINPDITIEQARTLDKHPALKLIEQAVKVMDKFPDPSPKDWRLRDPAAVAKVIAWLQGIESKLEEIVNGLQEKADAATSAA